MASREGHAASTVQPADEHHGGHAFPPFDSTNFPSTLFWLVISFGLLYLLMSKIALPRVESVLHNRQGKITSDLKEAHTAREKAEKAAATHERTIAEARGKAQALAQEAHAKIAAENDARRHALESDLAAKLATAEKQIVDTKSKAMQSVDAIVADAASAIVERITGRPVDKNAVASAVTQSKA